MQETHDCIYCVVDLHAITVPATIWGGPKALDAEHARGDRRLHRRRHRPEEAHRLQPEPGQRPCRARLGVQLRRPPRLAQPHDPVQGEGRQGPRERLDRPLRLSGADGGRHPRLSRHPRAGRRRPEAASRARPATSPSSSTTTSPNRSPATAIGDAVLPDHRAADHRAGDARHVAPRRHQEDVEVGPVRLFAHQPHRRCRHHRQKFRKAKTDPEPLPSRGRGAEEPRRRPTTSSASTPRSPASRKADGAPRLSAARSSRPSSRRSPTSRSRSSRRSPARCAACSPIPAYIDRVLIDGAERARAIAEKTMDGVKDVVGFVRKEVSESAVASGNRMARS